MNNKPITIGLTGPRLSGKDKVIQKFKDMFNTPVFDGDTAFKFIINYDETVRTKIKKQFGDNAFNGHFLNSTFFDKDLKVRKLLEIAEETVFDTFFKWRNKQDSKYVIFMFAGIYELMNPVNFTEIINIHAPLDTRQMRASYYLGEDMDEILKNEFPPLEKNDRSDYVIHNYDNMNLTRQVHHVHKKILEKIS